jgi:hypothetical protein
MSEISRMGMAVDAQLQRNTDLAEMIGVVNHYHVSCYDAEGNLKWEETIKNLVTTEGLNYIMNAGFKSGTQIGTWYVGLKDTGAAQASDSAANLGAQNWTEYTEYDEAVRQTLTLGTVTAGSVNNSGNVASFTIGSPAPDVFGVFVVDNNTKGGQSPATVLYGVGDFASQKVVDPNDTLNVTVTLSAASA